MKNSQPFRLSAHVKALWLAALRSGEYKQGRCHMRTGRAGNYKHCCLGVLASELGATRFSDNNGTSHPTITKLMPKDVRDLLANKNDIQNWSFKRIATWIEKHL